MHSGRRRWSEDRSGGRAEMRWAHAAIQVRTTIPRVFWGEHETVGMGNGLAVSFFRGVVAWSTPWAIARAALSGLRM